MNDTPALSDKRLHLVALVFALTFPTLVAWLYFLALAQPAGAGSTPPVNPLQQACYSGGKLIQFTFPVLFLWYMRGQFPKPGRPRFDGLALGLAFGLATALAMIGLYHILRANSEMFAGTPRQIQTKLQEFGVDGTATFIVLALFVSLVHSLLEEYYWRWFVFGQLRQQMALTPALLLSSLGFMAHHVIILYVYLPGYLAAVIPFSLGIAVGGAVWGWLYERYGTIYPAWLSHALVDGAIFVIGYDLLHRTG